MFSFFLCIIKGGRKNERVGRADLFIEKREEGLVTTGI
jgi:hypothetical protein